MRIFERREAWNSISSKKLFLQNAVNALNFEKNQIQNFFKQKARLEVNTFFLSNKINFNFNSSEYHQLLSSSNPNWLTNLQNQNKVTGNKKGKKGEFEDAAKYMLTVHRDDLFYFFILLYIGYNMNLHFKSESPNTKPILIPDTQTHLIQLKQILSLIGKFRITCTFLGYLKTMRVVQPHWIS